MEETNQEKPLSFYDYLENMTYTRRKELIKSLREAGIGKQQISNWFTKRYNVPEKNHELLCRLAGVKLSFPKLKRVMVIESEIP